MKIIAADVFVTSPSRNFVTLRITTEDGVTGIGDATLNGRELAVAAYLKEHVAQLLIGKDPHRIEDTWQFLYRSSYWRRGPVTMAAIAAVDMALWDIKGKMAGMPVYRFLGGASRNGSAPTATPPVRTSLRCSTPCASTWNLGTSPSVSRPPSRGSRPCTVLPRRPRPRGALRLRTCRPGQLPAGGGLGHPRLPAPPAHRLRSRAERVRPRNPVAARWPPPHDPHPGGQARQGPGTV